MRDELQQPLPVRGYTPQPQSKIELVNRNKDIEERVLRVLDALAELDGIDKHWLSIGRTQIEKAFMAINRSIFRPERLSLTE